ncbi:UNVERIFIED_CONTAM: hypothetical protein NCL1_30282 [Trichonephila clavipes]
MKKELERIVGPLNVLAVATHIISKKIPHRVILRLSCGRSSLMFKVMNWRLACHEFEPSTTDDPPKRGYPCALNLLRIKYPPLEWCGSLEGVASSSVIVIP